MKLRIRVLDPVGVEIQSETVILNYLSSNGMRKNVNAALPYTVTVSLENEVLVGTVAIGPGIV